jgi:hypothetical protein
MENPNVSSCTTSVPSQKKWTKLDLGEKFFGHELKEVLRKIEKSFKNKSLIF